MSLMFQYSIHTDDLEFVSNLLEKENFHRQDSSSIFIQSNVDSNIQIDLSESSSCPTIICCCSNISISLPRLVSFLNSSSNSIIPLIIFNQSSNVIDWNPLINLISTYNLSLNIVNDEDSFRRKLNDIIQNLIKQKTVRRSISGNFIEQSTSKEKQVRLIFPCSSFTGKSFLLSFM